MKTIEDRVRALTARYHTRDPLELCQRMGIHLYIRPDFDRLLGMYAIVAGRRCIFLNGNLDEVQQSVVLAHEIGHDQLHRKEARTQGISEFTLFNMRQRPEYEANVFAAHLLIDETQIDQMGQEGMDVVSIAATLETDINLVLIKLHEMKRKGFAVRVQDMPRADFLGKQAPRNRERSIEQRELEQRELEQKELEQDGIEQRELEQTDREQNDSEQNEKEDF